MTIAVAIFVATFILIAWGKVHRAYIGLIASLTLLLVGILTPIEAFHRLDFNVIGLLIGMSIMTYHMKESGLFDWVSIKFLRSFNTTPINMLVLFTFLGSLVSAILDNVSTTILLSSMAISMARALGVSIVPFVIGIAIGSNLVGAALMIGDPPSMMVASALDLRFTDFIIFRNKPSMFFMILTACAFAALSLKLLTKRYFKDVKGVKSHVLREFEERALIKDKVLAIESLIVLSLIIFLLSIRDIYNIPMWFPPILGAIIMLLLRTFSEASLNRVVRPVIKEVDWRTLIFISSVFVLTGGLVKTGFIDLLSYNIYNICGEDVILTSSILIWISVLLSGVIDNIPYFATMIPLVIDLSKISGIDVHTLMWALLLGGSLGGNCTYVGAAANAVGVGIIERNERKISLAEFSKIGVPFTVVAVSVGQLLHYLFYIFLA